MSNPYTAAEMVVRQREAAARYVRHLWELHASGPPVKEILSYCDDLAARLATAEEERDYQRSRGDEIREHHDACIKDAYEQLGIEDDGEYRWKWVRLGIHQMKARLADAEARAIAAEAERDELLAMEGIVVIRKHTLPPAAGAENQKDVNDEH